MQTNEGGASDSAPRAADRLGEAIATAIRAFVRLLLQHGSLAGAELAESGANFGAAAGFAVAALLLGFIAVMLLLAGAALALGLVLPLWLAFLCVGAAVALVAGILLMLARTRSRQVTLVPQRTIASLQKHLGELGSQPL